MNLTPTFTEITNWNKNPYSSTGGTRAKKIYVSLDDESDYFFKGSKELEDGTIRYPLEFWSEIAASKIGQWLGFDLLDYNIGYDSTAKQPIGCLSKSMIGHSDNTLSEGIEYLRGFDSKYNPLKDEEQYTVEFIKNAMSYFSLGNFENKFIEMLVFDAIIGNSDRHQENWGYISKYDATIQELNEKLAEKGVKFFQRIGLQVRQLMATTIKEKRKRDVEKLNKSKSLTLLNQSEFIKTEFSPIYDSGCCLGRELEDEKIDLLLKNEHSLKAYILKGKAEVRFEIGKKPKHFELLKILQFDHKSLFDEIRKRITNKYNSEDLKNLILNLDKELPLSLNELKLPENRKKLMIKLVDLRIQTFFRL